MQKLILIGMVAVMCACAPKVTVTVDNTLDTDRSAELVEIPVSGLDKITLAEGQTYVVTGGDGKVVPLQVTNDGLLILQSGLGAGQQATFTVKAGTPQEFPAKTKGRLATERKDDFIWENDRVAHRAYGTAPIPTDGPPATASTPCTNNAPWRWCSTIGTRAISNVVSPTTTTTARGSTTTTSNGH